MRCVRCAVINPWLRTVKIKEIDKLPTDRYGVEHYYRELTPPGGHADPKLAVDDFNIIRLARDICVFVDGEGFLKPDQPVWRIMGYRGKLCGMGLVLGQNGPDTIDLPDRIDESLCAGAVDFLPQLSTGELGPSWQEGNVFHIGEPILKDNADG